MERLAVALMPAAGSGLRLGLTRGCKEMLPVPDLRGTDPVRSVRPVCDYLLDQFDEAGLRELVLLRRAGKTDLSEHLRATRYELQDIVLDSTPGTPHTLLEGIRRVPGRTVAFGFPDMILKPPTLLRDTLRLLESSEADLALGLIPPADPPSWDMVALEGVTVERLDVRPGRSTSLTWGWCLAAARPAFGDWLERWLDDDPAGYAEGGEVAVGHAIAAAIADGLRVVGAREVSGSALDVGTPRGREAAESLGRADRARSGDRGP